MTPKPKFAEGEKVLCFHGPLIYEAKCLKSSVTKDKNVRYYIHYAGWNKNWDEWVPESRVLKYNDSNIQRQKEVKKAHEAKPAKVKRSLKQARKSETPAPGGDEPARSESATPVSGPNSETSTISTPKTSKAVKNPARDTPSDSGSDQPKKMKFSTIETEERYICKVVRLKLPNELRSWLRDDWDIITRQQKLINLPVRHSVEQILESYLKQKKFNKNSTPGKHSKPSDIVQGLIEYFNASLGSQLLYKFERPQYSECLHDFPGTPVSKMYGAVHLLRLITNLSYMLSLTCMDEKNMQIVQKHIRDIAKYLVNNRCTLFSLKDYSNATPEYHRKLQ